MGVCTATLQPSTKRLKKFLVYKIDFLRLFNFIKIKIGIKGR